MSSSQPDQSKEGSQNAASEEYLPEKKGNKDGSCNSVEQSTFISSQNNNPSETKIGPWSFIAHQLLGTGSFGEVYLVEKVSSGTFYAMKVLAKSKILGHNLTRYALTERNVLSI